MNYTLSMTKIQIVVTRHRIYFLYGGSEIYSYLPGEIDPTKLNSIAPSYIDGVQEKHPEITLAILERLILETLTERQAEPIEDARRTCVHLNTFVGFRTTMEAHGEQDLLTLSGVVQPGYAGISSSAYLRNNWRIVLPTGIIFQDDTLRCHLELPVQEGDVLFVYDYPVGKVKWCSETNNHYLDRNEPKRSELDAWKNQTGLTAIY